MKHPAWVLDFGNGRRAAVAHSQQLHLELAPKVLPMLLAPRSARHLLLWNEHCLPVLDFGAWCDQGAGADESTARGLLSVYAYAGKDGTHRLGALWLAQAPVRVDVDDARACELPQQLEQWRGLCTACFDDERFGAVPIVDLSRIFETPQAH